MSCLFLSEHINQVWCSALPSHTGAISGTAPNSVKVEDGEDSLTVTFDTVAGALG